MSPDRLRPHPQDRFTAPVQLIDLARASAELLAEPHPAVEGHRQIALFRHGPVTLVLFVLEPGAVLKEHKAEGVVTIHAASGRLVIVAEEEAYDLAAGQILTLAPGVAHTVRAVEKSEVVVTVVHMPEG
jgi:quercetin dioxygenase-like cupin family protein